VTSPRRGRGYLLDTDVLIGMLKRWRGLQALLDPRFRPLYCASLSRRELLQKQGLSAAERWAIHRLLSDLRILYPDPAILDRFDHLRSKYAARTQPSWQGDALVAATAWAKELPLVTLNVGHFSFVEEITVLMPSDLLG
jgi:predicted nucleic acid-binding protein